MSTSNRSATAPEDVGRLGNEILRSRIEPTLSRDDIGKFVAIAVDNGDYEVNASDQEAMSRLLARHPRARLWLARAGQKAAFRMGVR
jgi:hypothetical protein